MKRTFVYIGKSFIPICINHNDVYQVMFSYISVIPWTGHLSGLLVKCSLYSR